MFRGRPALDGHGMRRRLALAQALVPAPDLVLLDEPEDGLDPEGIGEMRRLVTHMNRERGVTVLLASHQLAGVEQLADRIAILDHGHLLYVGRPHHRDDEDARVRLGLDDWTKATPALRALGARFLADDVIALPPRAGVALVVRALVDAGVSVDAVEPIRPTLEDFYRHVLTQARTRDVDGRRSDAGVSPGSAATASSPTRVARS